MIALIAGTGALPGILAETLVARGEPPVICQMDGFEPDIRHDLQRLRFRIETLGTLLEALKTTGVTHICLAGAMRRPAIDVRAIDALTAPLVPALQAAMAKGDDGTLRAIIAIIEAKGFSVVGADQIAPGLLPFSGVLTRQNPSASHQSDAEVAMLEIAKMGQADLGQACVVRAGEVLAREGEAGTDAMLAGLRDRGPQEQSQGDPLLWAIDRVSDVLSHTAEWLSASDGAGNLSAHAAGRVRKGVLCKAPKPGQERRADLPVIGPGTAMLAAEAGLAGIVIAAGGVMVIDQPQVVSILDGHDMFLWVRPCQTP